MKACLYCAASLIAMTVSAFAIDDPSVIKGANDTRIRTIDYSEKVVTRIESTDMVPVVITYGDGEEAKLIAGLKVLDVTPASNLSAADKQKAEEATQALLASPKGPIWAVDHHANELTLQPVKADTGSMLVVTTDKVGPDGKTIHHHYRYELHTRDGQIADPDPHDIYGPVPPNLGIDSRAYFSIAYTYSAEDRAAKQAQWQSAHRVDIQAARDALAQEKIHDQLTLAMFGGPRSFMWNYAKDSPSCQKLAPARLSDNGQFTALYFPVTQPVSIPNSYDLNPPHTEERLDWHPEKAPDGGDLVVIHSVPKAFVLRRDQDVCLFTRDPKAPVPGAPFTGTSSPDVVRETLR